ncbi:hypothetical protein A2291_05230 [candidate division WOR-1 bacterium RIFOXYB2_FULL_42_35]|uniref:Uncharacterized protein n=1 Tax=candidate division WOR-1 bacterium RIFOXYC2_FULL_41_25 TaxID=1802586 RepID=A0A1F4TNK8_UNCSA|nr:MAG: hypothetical protein A2247_00650 [candidate division WOR-1 bacterium RIFOXYA2_FULL_41_14]OGC24503.1 MAG: hypothetical protein A2291_05230 [candidate division WOR-1 bacterium RIFOXYB2_FULL_42_35]OGC34120.1 MAG: hypothetical protein A2462_01090 [candidate division WOR-1 bacterium RIFOXYC2_FULL_41_25]OGC42814.1 MAG: hypothetical protein A2548_00710 [candidate division WOR-1 bacterium RIFOXYD2_FULL_41_8]
MLDRIGKSILVLILTAAVVLGTYLTYTRYFVELQDRTVELCVDLNDFKQVAAYEKKPLGEILAELQKHGVTSVGVLEETLPDANALGELYYAKGSGLLRLKDLPQPLSQLVKKNLIIANRTYIYIPSEPIRRRIYCQLEAALGQSIIKFFGSDILEIDEAEEELRQLGLGISEIQQKFLQQQGFTIVPRVWNNAHFHLGNIEPKIALLREYSLIIFDGDQLLGYPKDIPSLANALMKNQLQYGYIEIIRQKGDQSLRRLMEQWSVRVHSIARDEMKKTSKAEAVNRFVRAAKERKVRLIYIRTFLPPQVDAYPVAYNLNFIKEVKTSLNNAGFTVGPNSEKSNLRIDDWQLRLLGSGVIVGVIFLLNFFIPLNIVVVLALFLVSFVGLGLAMPVIPSIQLQKGLALLAAITFPALAVISAFSKPKRSAFIIWDLILVVVNVVAETMVGVFILVGLLADSRFMIGAETFFGVKIALLVPLMIVVLYFILNQNTGTLRERIAQFLNTEVKMISIVVGLGILGALGVYLARSGNFVVPVPALEKHFRNFLEAVLSVRPRSKEFLVGYPFLLMAASAILHGKRKWVWILAALGTIAPVSIINSFSHVHTPVFVSMARTMNGLILGLIIGLFVALLGNWLIKE